MPAVAARFPVRVFVLLTSMVAPLKVFLRFQKVRFARRPPSRRVMCSDRTISTYYPRGPRAPKGVTAETAGSKRRCRGDRGLQNDSSLELNVQTAINEAIFFLPAHGAGGYAHHIIIEFLIGVPGQARSVVKKTDKITVQLGAQ